MEGNTEKCPVPVKVEKTGKVNEVVKPKNKLNAPEKSAEKTTEKLPPKSERQQKLEERLKGTAWKVTNVDTTPAYRPAADIEKAAYASLSDNAAAAKGVIRKYDEKGNLKATDIVVSKDHKMTLTLEGDDFAKKLPKEARDLMKSLSNSGPHIVLKEVLVAEDGSVDLSKSNLRVSDRDFPPTSYVVDLEKRCKKILTEEGGLTPKALDRMEKTAIQLYQEQTAVSLHESTVEQGTKARMDAHKNLAFMWENLAEDEFNENGKEGMAHIQMIKDSNGICHGMIWKDIRGKLDSYSLSIAIDPFTGKIEELGLANEGGGSARGEMNDKSEKLTQIFMYKKISTEVLRDIKDQIYKVIDEHERKRGDGTRA